MQGIFNSRPPQPRYQHIWDVQLVLSFLGSWGDSKSLSLKDLSAKLVTLLALSNANRTSELKALDLKFRRYFPDCVRFTLPTMTKTRRSGPPKEVVYPKFEEEILCPVRTLKTEQRVFMTRTKAVN